MEDMTFIHTFVAQLRKIVEHLISGGTDEIQGWTLRRTNGSIVAQSDEVKVVVTQLVRKDKPREEEDYVLW